MLTLENSVAISLDIQMSLQYTDSVSLDMYAIVEYLDLLTVNGWISSVKCVVGKNLNRDYTKSVGHLGSVNILTIFMLIIREHRITLKFFSSCF